MQTPEDYQSLFESFLRASNIGVAEFKAFLGGSTPHCCMLRRDMAHSERNPEYDGIYLSENTYIVLDSLTYPEIRCAKKEIEEYLLMHDARLPNLAELNRFSAWKESMRCCLEKIYDPQHIPAVYSKNVSVTPENYWIAENVETAAADEQRSFIALRDEPGASPVLHLLKEVYQEVFKKHFLY